MRTLPLRGADFPLLVLACAVALAPSPARAGVFEIDQLCAVAGGCFPGDAGGFPVTITQPGTYRLTSNLDVRGVPTPQDVTAIDISFTADGVALDLNGFALLGPNTCSAPPAGCVMTGTGNGIHGSAEGTEVSNGSVTGFGNHGVTIFAPGARVDRVRTWNNGANGIDLEWSAAVVIDSSAWRNGYGGIYNDSGTTTGSTAVENTEYGYFLYGTSTGTELVAWGNGAEGFDYSFNQKLSFSIANANLGSGLIGHVHACVADVNGEFGLWELSAFSPYTTTLQSVYAANGSGSFGPAGIFSLGQNACNGGGC